MCADLRTCTFFRPNTEIPVSLNETISSKTHRLGDKVALTVAQDVKVDGVVLIPQGTRAIGQVTRRTNRGSFGKSGKMDVRFRYIDYNGQQIPLDGRHYRRRGHGGGTAGTIIGAIAGAVVGSAIERSASQQNCG